MITVSNQNHWLIDQAKLNPNKKFIITDNKQFTYSEIFIEVNRVSNHLCKNGIKENDHVAIIAEHNSSFIITVNACWIIGAVPVPVNNNLSDLEYDNICKVTNCKCLIYLKGKKHKPNLQNTNSISILEMILEDDADFVDTKSFDKNSTCLIIPTSGSTGKAKYVQLTFSNLFESVISSDTFINPNIYDLWLASLPFYHIGGFSIIVRTLCSGCSLVIPNSLKDGDLYSIIQEKLPSLISFVPVMMERILERTIKPWRKLRHIFIGGGPISERIMKNSLNNLWPISLVYGSTETSSMVSVCSNDNLNSNGISAGLPLPGVKITINSNENNKIIKSNVGSIIIESNSVSKSYYNNTDTQILVDGKFYSNDLGEIDSKGNLHIYGRTDKVIISGGENISLIEIENVLKKNKSFDEILVLGIKDEKWGQSYIVVSNSSEDDIEHKIVSHLEQKLPRFKLPKSVIKVAEIPKNQMGKILKKELMKKINFDLI